MQNNEKKAEWSWRRSNKTRKEEIRLEREEDVTADKQGLSLHGEHDAPEQEGKA